MIELRPTPPDETSIEDSSDEDPDWFLLSPELEEEKRVLRETIVATFQHVPYPGDDNIVVSKTWYEAIIHQNWLKGKHWKDIDLHNIQENGGSLYGLTGEAVAYYLPAFLFACLEPGRDRTLEYLLGALTRPKDDPRRDALFMERIRNLTPAHREVVRQYLEFLSKEAEWHLNQAEHNTRQRSEADEVLDSFWRDEQAAWDTNIKAAIPPNQ